MKQFSRRKMRGIHQGFQEKARYHAKYRHRGAEADPSKRESLLRLLAPNADQLIIVGSFVLPRPRPGLIDRLLVLAGMGSLEPVVVLNKVDLLTETLEADRLAREYTALGIRVIPTSVVTGQGMQELRAALQEKESLLGGHSGVGKSSLLAAVEPGLPEPPRVGEVSMAIGKGQHTTTSVKRFSLSGGGVVYDVPGLKLAPIQGLEPRELAVFFPELEGPLRHCRFTDCLHRKEPGCAVLEALAQGFVQPRRYRSYLRMLEQL